ncbi:phage tail assembly chaperone [Anaerophilus nitritogenes]|uniref:phage tail assembly chaperone n=1 Tax=Anaerophilus nitritogenes TaxID=2498136 RepID=UPI00101B7B80|nr:XkdN-like protein [Anaerophilus nitritogenes]
MNLQEFLNNNPVDNVTEEVVISERFKAGKDKYLKFKIKAMTNNEFEEIRKKSTTMKKKGKVDFDVQKFNLSIIIENTVYPDFKDAESIKKLGCITPEDYVKKVLLAGEIVELSTQIQKLSGFDQDMDTLVEEAKN